MTADRRAPRPGARRAVGLPLAPVLVATLATLSGCTHGLLSGVPRPDHSVPVVRIETTSGVEFGASTSEGILFLGRTATDGPCRVHYLLGPTPMVDDGELTAAGGVFSRAEIDLHVPFAHLAMHAVQPGEEVSLMWLEGDSPRQLSTQLARGEGLEGDLLEWPGPTPAGAAVLLPDGERWRFVGLIAGEVSIEEPRRTRRFLAFAGFERVRELLAHPRKHVQPPSIKYRPDDIQVVRDAKR